MIKIFCYNCHTQRDIRASILTRSHQDFVAYCPTCKADHTHHRVHD